MLFPASSGYANAPVLHSTYIACFMFVVVWTCFCCPCFRCEIWNSCEYGLGYCLVFSNSYASFCLCSSVIARIYLYCLLKKKSFVCSRSDLVLRYLSLVTLVTATSATVFTPALPLNPISGSFFYGMHDTDSNPEEGFVSSPTHRFFSPSCLLFSEYLE